MQSRYKLADVENLKSELELLPEVQSDSRQVTLKEAMKVLAPILKEMRQRRGYTNDQLLEVLRTKGITIAKSSLKDYLRAGRRPKTNSARATAEAKAERRPGQARKGTAPVERPTLGTGSASATTSATTTKPASVPTLPPPSASRPTTTAPVSTATT